MHEIEKTNCFHFRYNALMQIQLDGKWVTAELGETILQAAQREGIDIPTLCHVPNVKPSSHSCLVCLVKLNGRFVPSCAITAEEGMVIESETDEVHAMRRAALELLLSDHMGHCRTCGDGRKKCRLLKCIAKYRVHRQRYGTVDMPENDMPENIVQSDLIIFDSRKCIKCGICIAIAKQHNEDIGLAFFGRGWETHIGIPFDEPLHGAIEQSANDIIPACPTAALTWRR